MRGIARQVGEAEAGEGGVDTRIPFGPRQFEAAEGEGDVVTHLGHDDLVLRVGEDEADAAPDVAAVAGDVGGVDKHATGGRIPEAVDEARECRLAGAVGTDDADAVLGERQRDPVQGGGIVPGEGDGDVLEGDGGH